MLFRGLILGLVLVGFLLRLPGVWTNTFHADEALFASFARLIAIWRDPLLQTQAVDKPPLLFYLQAVFYPLLATPAGWPARLPNLIAGILLVPLTGRLAYQLYRDRTVMLVAVLIVCLSPLAIQFSASAFIDPLLTTLLVGALVLTTYQPDSSTGRGAYLWAGLLFGLALLTKYQAILFLPLVLGMGWLSGWQRAHWGRWLAGFLPMLLLFALWGVLRSDSPAAWGNQWQNIGGLRPVHSWELGPRLVAWGRLGQAAGGSLVGGLVLFSAPLVVSWPGRAQTRFSNQDVLLVLFILAYLALHWLVAIPVWDRYMLPLLPVLAVLAGRLASKIILTTGAHRRMAVFVAVMIAILMLPGAIQARRGSWPVGATPQADSGAGEVAAVLMDAPYGTVLYDHWFSWQWRYYFFDRGVYVQWFAHPADLAEDLSVFGDAGGSRYLVLPPGEIARPVQRAVQATGFTLEPVYEATGMILYQVTRP